jgi:nucleoside-diphosphate-sugar epimerase
VRGLDLMESLRILVTGSSGFIGHQVSRTLAEKFPESTIIGVGKRAVPEKQILSSNYEYISCDLTDGEAYKKLPDKIDVVIHLAGDRRTFVDTSDYTSQTITNILMTSRMADYAVLSKASLFIYASSVNVYTGNSVQPFSENDINLPIDNLGATKLAAESLLKARAVSGQLKVLALRIFTVYGPGARHDQFVPQAISKLLSPDPIAKFGPSDIKRDFLYIDDAVSAIIQGLAFRGKEIVFDVLNVGTGIKTSIREIVHLMADIIGTDKQIEFNAIGKMQNRPDIDHQADLNRVHSVLGWSPKVSLREGLRHTIDSINS